MAQYRFFSFFLGTLLLCALGLSALAPSAQAETVKVFGAGNEAHLPAGALSPPKAPHVASSPMPAYMNENQPLHLKDYDEPAPTPEAPWWQQLLGFIFKLTMVVGLIFLSLWALKRLSGGKISLPSTRGRNVVVLETTNLGAQQAIHLVSLGGDRLLVVGATPQSLNTLAEITDPAQVRHYMQGQKAPSNFNQIFDLEGVVQETGGVFQETLLEVHERPPGRERPSK
jgi:flagellar biogenesis protein FliO